MKHKFLFQWHDFGKFSLTIQAFLETNFMAGHAGVLHLLYMWNLYWFSRVFGSFWRAAFTETLFMKGTVNYCLSVRSAAASHLLCWVFLWCSFNHDQICWWHKTRWVKNGHVARPEMLWPWEIRGIEAMGSKGRLTVHKYRVLKGKGEEWWGKINIGSIKGNSLSRLLSQCCPNMSFYENNQLRLHSPKIAQMEWGRANAQNEKLLRILL